MTSANGSLLIVLCVLPDSIYSVCTYSVLLYTVIQQVWLVGWSAGWEKEANKIYMGWRWMNRENFHCL